MSNHKDLSLILLLITLFIMSNTSAIYEPNQKPTFENPELEKVQQKDSNPN